MRHVALAALVVLATAPITAQTPAGSTGKKVLSIDDYAKWRTISSANLSPDGKWAAYGLAFTNVPTTDTKPVLHIRNLGSNQEVTIADATQPAFSPDSRWIVYQVDPAATGRGGRGGRGGGNAPAVTPNVPVTPTNPPAPGGPPVTPPDTTGGRGGAATPPVTPRHYELRELATGKVQSWQEIQSAVFSPTGTHLLLRRRPAGGAGAAGPGAGAAAPAAATAARGTDMLLHDLAGNRTQFLGSVGESAFNRTGELLAYTVDAAVRDGNGLFIVNLKTGRTDVLDNDSLRYARLAWNDRGTGIAVLKGRDVEKMRERHNVLMVFADVNGDERAAVILDPGKAAGFPKGFEVSDRASLAWSDDAHRVFVGIIPQTAAPDTAKKKSADSVADVDVWRTQDERIQSVQMTQADADRNRTFREEFDIAQGKYVALSDSTMRELDLPSTGHWAIGRDPRAYISDFKRPAADFYRVNLLTGERIKMLTGQLTGAHTPGLSADGHEFIYWKDASWQVIDLDSGNPRMLAAPPGISFADMEEDHPGPRPPYSVAGYAADGSGIIVNHRFDMWLLPYAVGGTPKNITNGVGSRDKIVYRYTRTEPIDSSVKRASQVAREIDLSKPVTLSTYGEYTKKAGFSRLTNGTLQSIVYDDAAYSTPVRATQGDRYLYTRQTFSQFPDLLVAGADLANPAKISDANPQQADFLWGHRILFDFVTKRGDKLQGILALPDDYKPGEKRPMLVTFYEKNSQTMHRYSAPSFITGMGSMPIEATSRGYLTMLPSHGRSMKLTEAGRHA